MELHIPAQLLLDCKALDLPNRGNKSLAIYFLARVNKSLILLLVLLVIISDITVTQNLLCYITSVRSSDVAATISFELTLQLFLTA